MSIAATSFQQPGGTDRDASSINHIDAVTLLSQDRRKHRIVAWRGSGKDKTLRVGVGLGGSQDEQAHDGLLLLSFLFVPLHSLPWRGSWRGMTSSPRHPPPPRSLNSVTA